MVEERPNQPVVPSTVKRSKRRVAHFGRFVSQTVAWLNQVDQTRLKSVPKSFVGKLSMPKFGAGIRPFQNKVIKGVTLDFEKISKNFKKKFKELSKITFKKFSKILFR